MTFAETILVAALASSLGAENCTTTGITCSGDRTTVVYCSREGAVPVPVKECAKEGLFCVKESAGAVCKEDPKMSLICIKDGEFPNPMNCSQSYRCANGAVKEVCTCTGGGRYIVPVLGCPCAMVDKCPRKDITCDKPGSGKFVGLDGKDFDYMYVCQSNRRGGAVRSGESPQLDLSGKICKPVDGDKINVI